MGTKYKINSNEDDLFWAQDTTTVNYYFDVELHLLYGVDGANSVLPLDLLEYLPPFPPGLGLINSLPILFFLLI